ncbi:hypothetical protein BLNAU_21635 [Blattamonas nauphoetae]|uniref:Uncharacterized protein n=1 Tax=Blattamonas nauphoetae TaxID=2049346 RepID=A0ABQ9WXM4_9EUKA|nr:hypothetical protein BLNAU_21635 [Blattamonas nauphoetae]
MGHIGDTTINCPEYPFDNALQDKAARFLKRLEPTSGDGPDYAGKLMTDLVPSSDGSPSGFIDSVVILLSSPHSTVVRATMLFLQNISELGITATVDQFNHREIIFQKVVLPSSQFVSFLISNRHMLSGNFFRSFMFLLTTFNRICPLHRPTLEFVVASPIVMGLTRCLSFSENEIRLSMTLNRINQSLGDWKEEGPEVAQSGKRMMEALFSEGFEDTLEQMLKHDKDGHPRYHGLCFECSFYLTPAIPPDPRHSVLPPPPPNTPPTLSLSLSTISPSSFPDLVAEHIPNTPVVDFLLTHVATLEDEVKKLREERQEHLKLREEVESVKVQMSFLAQLLETLNKEQT